MRRFILQRLSGFMPDTSVWVIVIGILLIPATSLATSATDHGLLSAVLQDYVDQGMVDYAVIAEDRRLDQYLAQLATTDPTALPSDADRLALWLNAYNAYTLKLVADAYPIDSIHELATGGMVIGWLIRRTAWDIRFAEVGGEEYTLNEIEHDIIRPEFEDARIHFVIVCAAVSCPLLRSEAYEAHQLDEQLTEEGRRFLADPSRNTFDLANRQARISKIFDWFEEDFGSNDAEVIRYLAAFAPPDVADDMVRHAEAWTIGYQPYDWSLNDQSAGAD